MLADCTLKNTKRKKMSDGPIEWPQPLAGRVVGILVEYNFEDLELTYPLLRFREEGATVFTIGPAAGTVYKGKHGYPNKSDRAVEDVNAEELDALIIPGGFAPDYWRRDARFNNLVRNCFLQGKPVAAICHGPWMFVSAKILKGMRCTCFCSIRDDVENAGATFEDAPVVVDRNLISSRTPADLPHMCRAIMQQLLAESS
eukprot:TRINITY_DN13222_c0_g1_i2.p1 TRINITY_DN13222_c0_g1~~TRINITY_DN13222_c0_g1_i2.p1  ORF type:complete len:200 (+),score=60.48 TRINITY_DN13222_c0_g1_i2:42-641(+)